EELKLDTFTTHKLEDLIKKEIDHLIGQDIQILSESEELLISAIENKEYQVDDFSYHFKITKLIISTHIKITVEAELTDALSKIMSTVFKDSAYTIFIIKKGKGGIIWNIFYVRRS